MDMTKPNLLTVIIMLSVGGTVALSGCSQSTKANAVTLASQQQATQMVFDNQASRNNGAWGAVYMTKEEFRLPKTNIVDVISLPKIAEDASLQKWLVKFEGNIEGSAKNKHGFMTTNGKKLYNDSCAGCHMQDGKGAQGAGYYPPLTNNSKMQSKYYIISVVINGLRGMPSFHSMMSDEQIAAVTQYVHSDLNTFTDTVTTSNVAQLRHDFPPGSDPSE
ncbi:probable cytochrome c family protein [Psychrobacter arcticus 273-4]|uniref:Probable cytochrome c family protein n=1 Tax=Psychrobacter arcticus (strain DSM 17307 / VKM B-2377 / 273-4) TaxID=259536 RepID=Q4FSK4_PSYA2|nr:cytochrome c [Psychrobacter arcticus]AAZ19004.1 probable cytochrome c family protein [Psychrobacter arcticus 273-4]